MKIFAQNTVVAKSRVWYFLNHMKKVKKANGQIIGVYQVPEEPGVEVKNYGVWVRYVSRSGTHNMYREYRDTSLSGAVQQMYQEMASRHRARFSTIHVVKAVEVPSDKCKRTNTLQFLKPDLKFPKVGKIQKNNKKFVKTFSHTRPSTHKNN
jgi:large subunit ribosomal protein L18Ae